MVTIKDVAREAGVSYQTVSKVINNKVTLVKESTRQQVLEVIERLGYEPNYMASHLRSGKRMSIGVLAGGHFKDVGRFDLARLSSGIGERIEAENYFMMYLPQCGFFNNLEKILRRKVIDGLVIFIFPHHRERFLNETLPIFRKMQLPVSVLHFTSDSYDCPNVGFNIRKAGYLAAKHVLDQGCRVIRCFSKDSAFGKQHWEGYAQAMCEEDLEPEPFIPHRSLLTVNDGYELARKSLPNRQKSEAYLFNNDAVALGFIKACREQQIRIPEDFAMVGCDNLLTDEYLDPLLTTIDRKYEKHGHIAADLLFEQIVNNRSLDDEDLRKTIDPELIIRSSTTF